MAQEKSPRNTRVGVGVWLLEEEEKAWVLWKSLGPQEQDVGRGPTTGRWPLYQENQKSVQALAMRIGKNQENKDSGALPQ